MADRNQTLRVFCVGTADTKLDELRFLSNSVRSNLNTFSNNSSLKVYIHITLSLIFFYVCIYMEFYYSNVVFRSVNWMITLTFVMYLAFGIYLSCIIYLS